MDNLTDVIARGEKLFQSGNLDEAWKCFEEVIQTDPANYEALNNLGTVFYLKGDSLSAEGCYLKAYLSKNDNNDVLLNLTDLYLNAKRWEDALPFLESYLKTNTDDFVRINQLASIHADSSRVEQAIHLFERSLQIHPDQEHIKNLLKTLKIRADESAASKRNPIHIIKGAKEKYKKLRFSICYLENEETGFAHFLYDSCKYLCFSLESAGYDCIIIKNNLSNNRINIIIGGHRLENPKFVKEIAEAGPYVVIQSEMITDDTINNWPMQERFASIYIPLLQRATAVWDGFESNIEPLRRLGIEAGFIQFGYLPQLEEIVHKKNKDIDFLYYGSITPHRKRMLDALISKGGKVYVDFNSTAMYRNDLIARARINLAPKQSPEADHLPRTRVLYLLNNRSIVLVEKARDQGWIEHCFLSADTEEWVDLCMETLNRPDLDQIAGEYFERYKKINLVDEMHPLVALIR